MDSTASPNGIPIHLSDTRVSPFSPEELLDILSFPLCAIDRHLRVVWANSAWEQCAHLEHASSGPPAGQVGSSFLEFFPSLERSRWEKIARDVLGGKAGGEAVGWYLLEMPLSAQAEPYLLRLFPMPIPGEDGIPVGVLFACVEVGRRQDTERAHQTQNALRLDIARQLVASLSHAINNPLFVASATLEDLIAEAADPAIQQRLQQALDAVWRVNDIVRQFQEVRQIITTSYVEGLMMIDLDASQETR
jgi:signal transduction histidine kinase